MGLNVKKLETPDHPLAAAPHKEDSSSDVKKQDEFKRNEFEAQARRQEGQYRLVKNKELHQFLKLINII